MDDKDGHINYIELKAKDLGEIKHFYNSAFGWTFTDYGLTYVSFSESGMTGGFEKTDEPIINGALIVLYHSDLEQIKESVVRSRGQITKDIFPFPGGRRFHFKDPSENELAVWSDN